MPRSTYFQTALLVLVLLLGVFIRVGHFPHLPPGLNQDEAANAYESYSLAETGLDKWGNALPAYFPAWGSGQNVLLAYLMVPVVKVFGLSIFTARIVPLVFGLLTLPLFFYCLRPVGRFPALLATLLLAVAPWHFMLSHWALESNLAPFFMLLGCTTLSQAFLTQRRRWIVPSLLPFALSLYAYGTTIIVLPLLWGIILALCFRQMRPQWRSWLLALGLFLVVATPFLLFFTENYITGRNLAWTDSLFFSTPLLPTTRVAQLTSHNWSDIVSSNWDFVVSGFDDKSNYNLLPGYKPLLSFTLPFALVGLLIGSWKLIGRRGQLRQSPAGIVLSIFAAWGIASLSLLFLFELNTNRLNHAYLPCIVLAAWAIAVTISSFKPEVPQQVLRLTAVAWLLLEGRQVVHTYFTNYADGPIRTEFNDGMGEAFAEVKNLWGIDQVRITDRVSLNYVYALFYLQYPPDQFQREAQVSIGESGNYQVARFGRYVFSDAELTPGQAYGYLARRGELADTETHHREVTFMNEAWEVGIMRVTPKDK